MPLPLLTRVTEDGVTYALTKRTPSVPLVPRRASGPVPLADRMPKRELESGEQYRFHFDMGKCIGCKCCVVACNEQNGNPATINWRRVGDIEGGFYPAVAQHHLSMGCNHCLEPTCLQGCPVDAYSKDSITGIVRHSADACIGCQYCTWNCSYGVPQFNHERGVVGKCDMCHGRLEEGQAPACVSACPEGAIQIEIVNTGQWRAAVEAFAVPAGMPIADGSLSTTRVTLPANLPPNAAPRDATHVVPAEPHWPLVIMTVLTQLSVGAFATIWLLQLLGAGAHLGAAALGSLLLGGLALAASTMHLGRPIYAYRAIRMWKRSWLSREVLMFGAFSNVAALYAGALWFGLRGSVALGALTVLFGIAGVTASAYIYRVPARPAWNTRYTLLQFLFTSALLGPLFAAVIGAGETRWMAPAAAAMGVAIAVVLALRFLRLIASEALELKGTARLLSTVLRRHLVIRGCLLAVGGVLMPLLIASRPDLAGGSSALLIGVSLAMAIGGEILGRYLFFVSVVPRQMAAAYLSAAREAA
ncbi:MAG TPA: DmsC/YnfH family molybdoenzyme membrane anchor subunit [Vicinamibacterales bacterium]|jgi:Fe-S-cluster-containing dehydrogenase component/DMSO reductase anchor subunit|nr:DmsC/YnfH family molybdoenzyme membrane anchor subunit [Vicinamibacterales bacterium]